MKINTPSGNSVIIGKRVTVGVAIGSIATIFANLYPEYAGSFVAGATAVTFITQILIARYGGITR